METREKAIQGIIDALTEIGGVGVKTFYTNKNDNLSIEGRKSYGNVLSVCGEMYSKEDEDDDADFDGKNEYFECFIIWVKFEDGYERLCNLDTEDIVTIWNYMVNKLYYYG